MNRPKHILDEQLESLLAKRRREASKPDPDPVIQMFGTLLGTMAYRGVPEEIQEKVIDAIEAYSVWTAK
jgi:hypothetical protein